jgi:hypothetical protein
MNMWITSLVVVLTLLGTVASTTAQNFAMVGGEQFFTVAWERTQYLGKPYVGAHVGNTWGFPAADVRVKVEGLDTTGAVTSTTIDRAPWIVMPGSRIYFEIPAPPAPSYRVSVVTYTWVQTGGGNGGNGGAKR